MLDRGDVSAEVWLLNHQLTQMPESLSDTLMALSVFDGNFHAETASRILCRPDIPVLCSDLTERGLLLAIENGRFAVPEVMRPVLCNRLGIEECERVRGLYYHYYHGLIHASHDRLDATPDHNWLEYLESDAENILRVIRGAGCEALPLANSLWRWWLHGRPFTEGIDIFQRAIQTARSTASREELCQGYRAIGLFWKRVGNPSIGRGYLQRASVLAEKVGRLDLLRESLFYLGQVEADAGALDLAMEYHTVAVHLAQQEGNSWAEAAAFNALGIDLWHLDKKSEAREKMARAGSIFTEIDEPSQAAKVVANMALLAKASGDMALAEHSFRQALKYARRSGERMFIATCLHNLGCACSDNNKHDEAVQYHRDSLEMMLRIGFYNRVPQAICNLGLAYAAAKREPNRALILMGAAKSLFRVMQHAWPDTLLAEYNEMLEQLRYETSKVMFTRSYRKGESMNLEQVRKYLAI